MVDILLLTYQMILGKIAGGKQLEDTYVNHKVVFAAVLAQLESLVGDIKHSTNSVVPATLARAPGVVIRQAGHHGPPGSAPRPHPGAPRGGMRPAQQVVLPRHLMDQRRNTPSPNSKSKSDLDVLYIVFY